jgi:hypothetical protein
MPIRAKGNVERCLDVGDGAVDIENETIGMSGGDRQPVGTGECGDGGIVDRSGTELSRELRRGEVMTVIRAGGILDLLREAGEGGGIPDGERDGEGKTLGGWE